MNRKLFWKLCLLVATGVVALFYMISILTSRTEEGMSFLANEHRAQLTHWGKEAERLYLAGDKQVLQQWLLQLGEQESTWLAVAKFDVQQLAGDPLKARFFSGYNLGRSVDWKVHLYFADNPVMELPFDEQQVSFLIQLPERMRPGVYWRHVEVIFQIVLPTILLALLALVLYRHIMKPLLQLQMTTSRFSSGNYDVRAQTVMGNRNDEFSELARVFDHMATRISGQIYNQRQLIADLSHELRTPLTRLDIAVQALQPCHYDPHPVERIERESKQIRQLVEDTLTLAWLENEQPQLQQEEVEIIDLLDVLIDDARFEFPDRHIDCQMPDNLAIYHSSHRAAGQALENILRNALRHTPVGGKVSIVVILTGKWVQISIEDEGPGVPVEHLENIFKPFFRLDKSRAAQGNSFGLGLALARRQLATIRARITANNRPQGGLQMQVDIPLN
ncbi:sensor histidine kinase [Shewanella sp. Scap07]|uniref:sensor histidine kinase n=1 Tax=Shewanella sp. Scap07 TaxID=2589987 RepID=UPI0015B96376|nr:sensor histidine kinase [Shewanella sp. Scap07]QLE86571.1 sensor histidine kinase [Shewanella sp. Scap07]